MTVGFDYYDDKEKNMEKYGQDRPPVLVLDALKSLKVPISLFVGEHDTLATTEDVRKLKYNWLNPEYLHHYEEFKADHLSFFIGHDMSYFSERVMGIIKEH